MSLTYNELKSIIKEELGGFRSLHEQEEGEEEGGGEEEIDDLFGDEEEPADDATTGPTGTTGAAPIGGEDGNEEPVEGEPEEEEPEEEEEPKEEEDIEPTGPSDFGLDQEINDIMGEFESKALQSAAVQQEGYGRYSLTKSLLEIAGDDVPIDVASFASDVHHLIQNYSTLMDMEKLLYTKGKEFLNTKYGDVASQMYEDIFESEYDMSFGEADAEASEVPVYAMGALSTGG